MEETSLQKCVAFPSRSKATASSKKKPDVGKYDMRDISNIRSTYK